MIVGDLLCKRPLLMTRTCYIKPFVSHDSLAPGKIFGFLEEFRVFLPKQPILELTLPPPPLGYDYFGLFPKYEEAKCGENLSIIN